MTDETSKKDRTAAQIEIAEALQDALLDNYVSILADGTATATDRATIQRLLQSNGWTLDPSQLPTDLKNKLTSTVKFDEELSEDELGQRRKLRAI